MIDGRQQQYGIEAIRQGLEHGIITHETLVWRDGFATWVASDAQLCALLPPPPPTTPSPPVHPWVGTGGYEANPARARHAGLLLIALALMGLGWAMCKVFWTQDSFAVNRPELSSEGER